MKILNNNLNKKKIPVIVLLILLSANFTFAQSGSAVIPAPAPLTTDEVVVRISLFSRKLLDRTEYMLGVKNKDLKKLTNDTVPNDIAKLTKTQHTLIQSTLFNLKKNQVSSILKSTDPNIVNIEGQKNLLVKYKEASKYFANYKSGNYNISFATTLADDSVVLLGDFRESDGGVKIFSMVLSRVSGKYFINSIFAGETTFLVAFDPMLKKEPITVFHPVIGFSGKDLREVDGYILIPTNWFYRHEDHGGTQAYFISEQEIKKDSDIFETGLTMNVAYQASVPGGDAVKYIDTYLNKVKAKGTIEKITAGESPDHIYKQVIGTFDDNGYKYKMAVRVIANKETNTIYILIFESTLKKWNTNWNTKGKPMFDYLSISR